MLAISMYMYVHDKLFSPGLKTIHGLSFLNRHEYIGFVTDTKVCYLRPMSFCYASSD